MRHAKDAVVERPSLAWNCHTFFGARVTWIASRGVVAKLPIEQDMSLPWSSGDATMHDLEVHGKVASVMTS